MERAAAVAGRGARATAAAGGAAWNGTKTAAAWTADITTAGAAATWNGTKAAATWTADITAAGATTTWDGTKAAAAWTAGVAGAAWRRTAIRVVETTNDTDFPDSAMVLPIARPELPFAR